MLLAKSGLPDRMCLHEARSRLIQHLSLKIEDSDQEVSIGGLDTRVLIKFLHELNIQYISFLAQEQLTDLPVHAGDDGLRLEEPAVAWPVKLLAEFAAARLRVLGEALGGDHFLLQAHLTELGHELLYFPDLEVLLYFLD